MIGERQEQLDRFYFRHGPCCAGCDWWRSINVGIGQCIKAAPVSGAERLAMIGIDWGSMPVGAGHPFTKRKHVCGDFKDDFDWSSLPAHYRRSVGDPNAPKRDASPLDPPRTEGE